MNLYEMFNGAKKKLVEGGNLSVGGQEAQQIDLKVHNRSYIVPILDTLLRNINNSFAKTYNKPLWNPALLQKKEFLSGSSLHFFNTKGISDQDFVAKKPKVGDIDTQVNKENEQELEQWLTASQGKMVGNAKFIGFQRGNEQFSSLWELQDPPIKVQIDLEFVAFEKDEPTAWSKFSHSSSWDDLNAGVKGVFHKFLIQSLASLSRKDFLLRKSVGRGKAKELQDIPTTDNMVSFAVSSKEGGGLRAKYEPIVDANGQPVIKDGLPVMQALPASGYEQDIGKIFASIFADRLNAKKAKQLESKYWSFVGLIDAMNALLTPEEKQTVLGAFIDKTFGKGAQGLYRGDPERDSAEKSAALNLMISKLGVQAPADLEQIKQQYKAAYKVVAESLTEAPDYKRQGIQHIYAPGSSTEMKDLEFIEMCKEIAENGGTLDGMAVNLKADGAGIRFGKDAAGRPFFMTSKVTEPKYAENIGDFERFGVEQGQTPERLAFTKKYDDAMSIILNSDFIKSLPDDTIVQAEMMYNDMAQQTPQGLKFVNIPYDAKKLGKTMTLVPFMFKTFSTGETRPDAEAIKKKLLSMSDNNIKMVNNQLQQKGIDVSKIIEPVVNMDPQLVAALSSRVRNNPGKEQAKEILTAARQQLSQAIIENPNLKGKDQLGDNMEGIVVNLPSGRLAKVTSQLMKTAMAAKKAPQAAPAKQGPAKTAVVAIGSFVGHKGHQELFKYTIDKAKEVGGDPFLFMGNAVGVDDPVPVEDKIKTWKQLYPSYAGNISATMQGGSLMQKIKHELINPMPGQPPKYDNIIIMVGEDQAGMNIANALMKAVNKFPGYEHVKASLQVTPRGTGMSFTKLRNILKTGDEQTATNMWTDAFNGGNSGAKPLPPQWIKHLMDVSKKGMGIVQPKPAAGVPMAEMRLFNALMRPTLNEYGDTAKGQKMLTKVQKRAVDRMIKADDKRDAKAAKKNQDTANRAWDRMTDVAEADSTAMANTAQRLTDPKDGATAKLRAAGDKRREDHLKSRDIAKKNEAMLPKSAFTGSDKNKLGPAGQLKGTAPKEQPTHKLVGETDKKKGADGKACWKGYKYAGTKNGKDKCVPIGEAWSIEMAKAVIKLVEGKK